MAVRSILLRIIFAIFAMVARTHCLSMWLESDYVFQGNVFNITCAAAKNAFGTLNIYYPDKPVNASVTECKNVTDEFSDYVSGYCASNDTDRSITMQVSGANFSRDDGIFTCKLLQPVTITLDVRVYSDITRTVYNDTHASCTASCGYPVDTSWYEGDTDDPLPGHTEVAANCSGEDADTKQRIVTTSIALDQATSQQLKCCVINTDEADKSACATLDLTPVATSTTPPTPTAPDDSFDPPAVPEEAEKGAYVTLKADHCSDVGDTTVGWYSGQENCKSEDDLNDSDLQKGSESNFTECTGPFRTRSTWTVTAGEVECVTCCIIDRQGLTFNSGTCTVIKIPFIIVVGLSIASIIAIVICLCVLAAAIIGIGVCWKKKIYCWKEKTIKSEG